MYDYDYWYFNFGGDVDSHGAIYVFKYACLCVFVRTFFNI